MKERPIIFSGESVRAILAGRKTQTRRLCKQAVVHGVSAASVHPDGAGTGWISWWPNPISAKMTRRIYPGAAGFHCPHGSVGDRLWVREGVTWSPSRYECTYDADGAPCVIDNWCWKTNRLSPIFLPRGAARLHLEITDVRVQRLQDITEDEARAEGVEPWLDGPWWSCMRKDGSAFDVGVEPDEEMRRDLVAVVEKPRRTVDTACGMFARAWDAINGKRAPWASNPWVWAITFRRVKP